MEQQKKDFAKHVSPVVRAISAIREKEGKKRSLTGTIECPECKAELRYSIAFNGHIHGKCSGCGIGWMM